MVPVPCVLLGAGSANLILCETECVCDSMLLQLDDVNLQQMEISANLCLPRRTLLPNFEIAQIARPLLPLAGGAMCITFETSCGHWPVCEKRSYF